MKALRESPHFKQNPNSLYLVSIFVVTSQICTLNDYPLNFAVQLLSWDPRAMHLNRRSEVMPQNLVSVCIYVIYDFGPMI